MEADRYFLVRTLAFAYAALALLAAVARWLPAMNAVAIAFAVVVLAVLPAAALWHRGAVGRLARLHRFAPDRWLRRWAVRRFLAQAASAVVALVLSAAVILQSPFFGKLEWALLASAPLAFVACRQAALARGGSLFSRSVYAIGGADAFARLFTFALLCAIWLGGRYAFASADARPLAEAVHALQTAWPATATSIARWAIDAGAWSEPTLAMLATGRDLPWWRIALFAVLLPATMFGHAVWSAAGASLDAGAWRRTVGASLTDEPVPPPVSRTRAAGYVACVAVATAGIVLAVVRADDVIGRQPRWLALESVPKCERIGARVYSLGTLAKLDAYANVIEQGIELRRGSACARLAELRRVAERNVDAYLDWYWSLGAEYTRLALSVAGEVDALHEVKLARLVTSEPRFAALVEELRNDNLYVSEVASRARNGLADLLEQQRLVLDERQCKVVAEAGTAAGVPSSLDRFRDRQAASAAAGVLAAAFAGTLAKRAVGRASVQGAGRVAAKAATRGAGRAGSAAAGAAAGSVVPGVGTVAGLVVGTLGADVALLAVEEALMRPEMKRQLLADVEDLLGPLRRAIDCPAS